MAKIRHPKTAPVLAMTAWTSTGIFTSVYEYVLHRTLTGSNYITADCDLGFIGIDRVKSDLYVRGVYGASGNP